MRLIYFVKYLENYLIKSSKKSTRSTDKKVQKRTWTRWALSISFCKFVRWFRLRKKCTYRKWVLRGIWIFKDNERWNENIYIQLTTAGHFVKKIVRRCILIMTSKGSSVSWYRITTGHQSYISCDQINITKQVKQKKWNIQFHLN